jgi:hypothetical protein
MILDELTRTNDRWAQSSQPQVVEATVAELGSSSTSYAIQFKNGSRATNIEGPSGLLVGNAVVVVSYPGKAKKYAILQKTSGGSEQEITTVQV